MDSRQGVAPKGLTLVGAIAAVGVMLVLVATSRNDAEAQGGDVDSACPSRGTPDAEAVDPLEGPSAEDTQEEDPPVIAEVEVPSAPVPAGPNQGLKPILRPTGKAPVSAPASADALTRAVELTLRWCVVQPVEDGAYQWGEYETAFAAYRDAGIRIRTVRVTDAPKWAASDECVSLAATGDVKLCPPTLTHAGALQALAQAVASHFGPASTYDVERLAFWNEPNLPRNWGTDEDRWGDKGPHAERLAAERYSDLLVRFHQGTIAGDPAVKVDAGEIAAGSTQQKGNGARTWAEKFTAYNTARGRNGRYNVLTIHPYSEFGGQIPAKVANYKALPGVAAVGVTEFAWGVSDAERFKCVLSDGGQVNRFQTTLTEVRQAPVGVHRLAWFSVIDNPKSAGSKCPDNSEHYLPAVRNQMNTYGLFKRRPDGLIDSVSEATHRLLRVAFRNAQQ